MQGKQQITDKHISGFNPVENACETNDYAEILDSFGIIYKPMEYYWQAGEIQDYRGWILHLSVVIPNIAELLRLILPQLIQEEVIIKVIRNRLLASQLLEGLLGSVFIGKMISIYPRNSQHALKLAKELISLTKDFKGPRIPTACCLGEILYTQYENYPSSKYASQNEKVTYGHSVIEWPFEEITSSTILKRPKLLNSRYYPFDTIKHDAKGDVVKALYFSKFWNIRTCIIKQGRKYMLFDDYGRDIQNRLKWQYELCGQLSDSIPLPKAIDFFEEYGDVYFVMEFVRGSPVTKVLDSIFKNAAWYDLPRRNQIQLIAFLSEVLGIIHQLHEKGFIHRDITPENFLIDKNQHTWMLDIELMWPMGLYQSFPPFQLGTPGFISPEQLRSETPTIKQDIYSIGAFLLTLFTNLPPIKFLSSSKKELKENLFFFIKDDVICELISDCLNKAPMQRPDLTTIRSSIDLLRNHLQQQLHFSSHQEIRQQEIKNDELRMIIQAALNGLGHSDMLSQENHWLSIFQTPEHKVKNEQIGMIVCLGWHIGLAGPLWLLAIAKENKFDIENCSAAFQKSWDYIIRYYFRIAQTEKSLYSGGAGISLALSAAFRSHLLPNNNADLQIEKCFSKDNSKLSLAEGIAGMGLALLQARDWMNRVAADELLNSFANSLLNTQRTDGTWNIVTTKNRQEKTLLSLEKGVTGIVWFLLHLLDGHSNNDALNAVAKALNWLIKSAHKTSTTAYSTNQGLPGVTLTLVKAFQVTGDNRYRTFAESNLKSLPDRPVLTNFSLGEGLAGLGEIYLEAYKAFKDPAWLERAGWIARVFLHTFQRRSSGNGYWITDQTSNITADLFTGNTGIIHFLMHYLLPDKMHHPLVPYSTTI